MLKNHRTPFAKASYKSQIVRLRAAAAQAMKAYPIRVASISLLNHGENTTFKVVAADQRKYVLRIHRHGYHSPAGLDEEFKWMDTLREIEGLSLPSVVLSLTGKKVISVERSDLDAPRCCDLLVWTDGHFRWAGLGTHHLFALGQMTARIHLKSRPFKPQIRTYWTAEGLLGNAATIGPFEPIPGASASDVKLINQGRKRLFQQLKTYESRFPDRLCMLHADLHFGNLLWQKNGIGIIDFDDSGFGFRMYDLAVTCWMINRNKKIPSGNKSRLRQALLEGYATVIPIDNHDSKLLDTLITTRELVLLGWLLRRQDNPKLRPFMRKALQRNRQTLRRVVGAGA